MTQHVNWVGKITDRTRAAADRARNIDLTPAFIIRTGFILTVVAIVFFGIRAIGVDRLQAFVAQAGIFAPILYVALRAIVSVIAPFSSGPLQMASGILFGLGPAVLYSVIGSTIGYSISFWLARVYGRDMVKRLLGDSIERVDAGLEHLESIPAMIFARGFLFFAYDFIAYAAGLSDVRFPRFLLISLIVGIPPIAITIIVGLLTTGGMTLRQLFPLISF